MRSTIFIKTANLFIGGFCSIIFLCTWLSCSSANKIKQASYKNDIAENRLKIKMKAGETHRYSIYLNTGELAHIKVAQYNLDVMAKVSAANGEWQQIFDSPNGELDAEDIYLLSNSDTKYEIEIYPAQKYADPGEYQLRVIRLQNASEHDKKWMAALASTQKADKLRTKTDTRQQSIQQYELAVAEWMAVKDTEQYARTMRSMGFVYIRLRNYEKAVEVFSQLLPVWKQLGDPRAEGFTHLIIGRIYDIQKNYSMSLDYNLNSLEYWLKVKDADQESFVIMNVGNLYAHLGDKQKAIDNFEQALKKNEQSQRPSIKAVIQRDYATAMLSVGETEKGIKLYKQSLKQWQATVNTPEEARTAVLLAAYYAGKENKQEATHYYHHALNIWKKLDEPNEMKKIESLLEKL